MKTTLASSVKVILVSYFYFVSSAAMSTLYFKLVLQIL